MGWAVLGWAVSCRGRPFLLTVAVGVPLASDRVRPARSERGNPAVRPASSMRA